MNPGESFKLINGDVLGSFDEWSLFGSSLGSLETRSDGLWLTAASSVPEPSSLAALGFLGLGALIARRRRNRKS